MASLKDRAAATLEGARARSRLLDHAIRTQQHFSRVKGNIQAGAATYFAFLSFFPILALAFFVVGYVARIWPEASDELAKALNTVLPGLVGPGDDQISLSSVQDAAGTVGLIGVVGLLYSGLGWLAAMRDALIDMFQEPPSIQPSFVAGKLRDLVTLGVIGLTLVFSVVVSGAIAGFSTDLLDLVGLGTGLTWLLALIGVGVGGAADMVLFYALFRLLAKPRLPARSLWAGALLGAVGAELLKWASSFLIGSTKDQPAFQAFGIALILIVWINYFSRVAMYAAAWAFTSPRSVPLPQVVQRTSRPDLAEARGDLTPDPPAGTGRRTPPDVPASAWFGSGAAVMLAVVALASRWSRKAR
jgi:membrane protein